ncbi:MAG: DHH family phosphoesterase [Nanobdellota archaeon]
MNRYVLGSENIFYDFIDSLSKKDKIGIVTHTDVDGIASGIFLQKILESKGLEVNFIEFLNYGVDSLKEIINRKYDVLFFTDWNVDTYLEKLEKIEKKSRLLVVDHHPTNPELKDKSNFIKTEDSYCSSHVLFDLAENKNYFDTKDWKWLACVAIIADYTWDKNVANFNFIKSVYPEVKKDIFIWDSEPGKIGKKINNALIYYSPDFKKVYDIVIKKDINSLSNADNLISKEINFWIDKFRKEAEYFIEQKLYFAYGNPEHNIISTIASKLSDEFFRENTVVFASDIKDKKGFVKLSARNQTGKVDLGKLLKRCVEGLEKADAGGHPRASAGRIMKKDLGKFKEKLLIELKSSQ